VVQDVGPNRTEAFYRALLDRILDGLPKGTRPRQLRRILYRAERGSGPARSGLDAGHR